VQVRLIPKHGKTIDGIQVLRGVAAAMVVIHHSLLTVLGNVAWPLFGQSGVDIFFVISGFVMAYTTRYDFSNRGVAFTNFLSQRIVRIVPLYWLASLWTSRRLLFDTDAVRDLVKDLFFIPHPNRIYSEIIAPTLIPGWTLNYEMFFYLLFGIALLFGNKRTVIIFCALLSLTTIGLFGFQNIFARFYTDSIILEFAFGILLFNLTRFTTPILPRSAYMALAACGFALIAAGYGHFPRGLAEGLPAALIVWSSIYLCDGWLRWKPIKILGDSSYAIYLFNWGSFGVTKPIIAWLQIHASSSVSTFTAMALNVTIAICSGVLIHLCLEKPLLRWMRSKIERRAAPAPA
jgi:exopolysaccharide production protein ExoZ